MAGWRGGGRERESILVRVDPAAAAAAAATLEDLTNT